MNKYIKNYLLNTINTVLMLLFPIITFPYVSRVLGPSKLGIINFVQSYGYYFLHLASFGISSYAIREVSKVRDDPKKVEKISNEIFNINFFFSILSTIVYFSGLLFASNLRDNFIVLTIYSIVIISNFLSLDWLLQSFDDYFFSTIRNTIIRILSIIAVFVFVKKQEDYIVYLIISCLAEMGTKFSTLTYSRKKYANLKLNTKFLNFKDHIRSLFTLFIFRIVNGVYGNIDKLMIGFMMLYDKVGIYTAGVRFVVMMQTIVEISGIVLFPKINISAKSSVEDYKKNLKINYDLILLLGIPMAVGMFLVSARLIPLFAGDEYLEAISISRIMSVVILLGPIGDMLGSKTLLIFQKEKQLLICSSIVAISNILLNLLFISMFGINGAAIASVLSCIIAVSLRYYFTRKIVKINLINKSFIKYCAFVIPFVVIYIIFQNKIDNDNIRMFGFVALCTAIYIFELIISKDELTNKVISNILKRIKRV